MTKTSFIARSADSWRVIGRARFDAAARLPTLTLSALWFSSQITGTRSNVQIQTATRRLKESSGVQSAECRGASRIIRLFSTPSRPHCATTAWSGPEGCARYFSRSYRFLAMHGTHARASCTSRLNQRLFTEKWLESMLVWAPTWAESSPPRFRKTRLSRNLMTQP